MIALEFWPIIVLLGLGALHGVNPAMGWLFAVALGLQERSARAVWRALPPLALGHALSVAAVVVVVALVGTVVSPTLLRAGLALVLVGFGARRLFRGHRSPGMGGMRMNRRELVVWSFLMATAHGAGLMVVPFVLDAGAASPHAHHGHAAHLSMTANAVQEQAAPFGEEVGGPASTVARSGSGGDERVLMAGVWNRQWLGVLLSLLHALSYLLVSGVIAVVVYEKVGVQLLRTAWINLDIIWAAALMVTGVVVLVQAL